MADALFARDGTARKSRHGQVAMTRPDFFIVGAPKCGTTALHSYLGAHPEVFMPRRKEPHFFGGDLRRSQPVDLQTYLSYFASAGNERRVGEASTSYLYSRLAAEEIKAFCPDARIIVMLRNPVDMIHSLHGQRLYQGAEDIEDFARAVGSEASRCRARGLPDPPDTVEGPIYRPIARFAEQLERYFRVFGRERVRVILFDDLVADTHREYRATLGFLGVSEDFTPPFAPVNEAKQVRSRAVAGLLRHPPATIQRAAGRAISQRSRERLYGWIRTLNTRRARRPPIDPALRRSLEAEFATEVTQLSQLLGRDLSSWTAQTESES